MGQQAVETEWADTINQAQFSPIGASSLLRSLALYDSCGHGSKEPKALLECSSQWSLPLVARGACTHLDSTETRKIYWNGRLSSLRDRTDSPIESPLLSRSFCCYIPYIAYQEALSYLLFLLGFRPLKGRTKESCEKRGVQNPKKISSRSIPATLLTSLGERSVERKPALAFKREPGLGIGKRSSISGQSMDSKPV
ncbi:hypothetical protein ACH5RR_023942 [Cinchona calisaya]|uniref:Uncharacterized protein n=1 Tax=Cinchona calisaya TaxID=153742 RepID=A0ABD2ZC31_9GENT